MVNTYSGISLILTGKEVLTLPATWMNLEGIILTDIIQMCKVKALAAQSCLILYHPMEPARLLCPWDSPGKNTGVGCHSIL